jgi:hypothetical protein
LDYSTSFKSANQQVILYAPDQFRSSDHDPILVGVQLLYDFDGFFPPVQNAPAFNLAQAGRSIPIKFSLNGDWGLDILVSGYPTSHQIACDAGSNDGDETNEYTGSNSGLTYDPIADQYVYVWQTENSWANTCRQFTILLNDGSQHILFFRFR